MYQKKETGTGGNNPATAFIVAKGVEGGSKSRNFVPNAASYCAVLLL
jgi:hypothetical protein